METTDESCGYKTKNQCYVIKRQNSHTCPLFASDSLNKGPVWDFCLLMTYIALVFSFIAT